MARQYLEVPCLMLNPDERDLMGKKDDECELIEVIRKIRPSRIEGYAETIPLSDFREDNKIWTAVVMESGDNFIVNMPLKDFENLIKPYL